MKKLLCVVLMLCFLPLAVPAAAETRHYQKGRVAGPHYSMGPVTVSVKVFMNGSWGNWGSSREETEKMIRSSLNYMALRDDGYCAPGARMPAGERLDLLKMSEDRTEFILRLKEPGYYDLWGVEYYVLDPANERQAAFAQALEETVSKCIGKTETETARKLEARTCKNIIYPKDQWLFGGDDGTTEMMETTGYTYGVWCTGYGTCGGYSSYYMMLCSIAGIECLPVSGTVKTGGHTWVVNRLDGVWSFTDPTWDDDGSDSKNRYFAVNPEKIGKDHEIYAEDLAFWKEQVGTTPFDREVNRIDALNSLKDSVPRSLLALPATAEGYDFPADDSKALRVKSLSATPDVVEYRLNRKAEYCALEFYWPEHGFASMESSISIPRVDGDRVEIAGTGTDIRYLSVYASDNPPSAAEVKKGASVRSYFIDGECVSSECTFLEPLPAGSVDRCLEGSWRSWTTDNDGLPLYATWYILTGLAEHTVTVYFDGSGAVSRYTVRHVPNEFPERTSEWTALADGTVISGAFRNGKDFVSVSLLSPDSGWWMDLLKEYPHPEEAPEGARINAVEFSGRTGPVFVITGEPVFEWADGTLALRPSVTDYTGKTVSLSGTCGTADMQSARTIYSK